ncbi:3-phosphoshikimate 1-carboxyvinyltransferase [Pelagibacteraceae bacterium]|jgi:3-phosphoshikimate 1-carboxyvinyltransferase|nr:3-phosphoshikimate 1-carboxyvinyltransferase [Pelagibacteraceae bacterium]
MQSKSFNLLNHSLIKPFKKTIVVDSDKSLSIRSFLIGSISEGISKVKNVLESDDVFSTINCLKKLGVKIKKISKKSYLIYGKGLGSLLIKKNMKINFGNSGTLARLLIGILSTTPNIEIKIQGDNSLNKRSMKKLIELMSVFGAEFLPKKKFNFPLKLISTEMPVGINYKAGVSAQLKSAVILAGLNSFGITEINEIKRSRDHTENMLAKNSKVIRIKKKKIKKISIFGKKSLSPINMNIPGDPSSAAFFTALTLLNKNSSIKIKNVGLNSTRIGFYELLKKHGAKIKLKNLRKKENEIFGDIHVKSSKIKPINASREFYVKATDEYPILFVIAALTQGRSIFKGIKDLANKESNRIKEMQKILEQIGVKCITTKDDIKIYGNKLNLNYKQKIFVPNLGDHRICMSAQILSLITGIKTQIDNFETVNTSAPSFLKIIKSLGGKFEIEK